MTNQISFENKLTALEAIVQKLESKEISLDDAITQFELGAQLYNQLKKELSDAERKITLLSESLKEGNY